MKPEKACFNPEGCKVCIVGGKLYLKTESGVFCCIKNPSKLDANIVEVFSNVADCPDEGMHDNLLIYVAVYLAALLLLTGLLLYMFCSSRRHCPSRAFESIDPENRDIFWEHPDMELQSVRARVIFNRIQGNFQLVLNFPVSAEITKKLKGWNGPTLLLTHLGIKHLEAFLIELAAPAYFDSQPNL
ncbi:unnamed protein product [Allacma fusca]|uniref:Uncharacterized protein n=1 Tax=Allacma fusca TaxID=39272 RepID=A0A8J2PN67_9HEXA|nr:unnamed protein product [Allacma fusca]